MNESLYPFLRREARDQVYVGWVMWLGALLGFLVGLVVGAVAL